MTKQTPMYRLVSRALFVQLMERTGTGAPVTIRDLADDTGVNRSTIGHLRTGVQETVPGADAEALAQRLGVDLLVAFEPVCRSTTPVRPAAGAPEQVPA